MPRAAPLSEREKGKLLAYKEEGVRRSEMARRIRRSPRVVGNFLKDPEGYGKKKRRPKRQLIDDLSLRRIRQLASNTQISTLDVRRTLKLPGSKTTVWRAVKRAGLKSTQSSRSSLGWTRPIKMLGWSSVASICSIPLRMFGWQTRRSFACVDQTAGILTGTTCEGTQSTSQELEVENPWWSGQEYRLREKPSWQSWTPPLTQWSSKLCCRSTCFQLCSAMLSSSRITQVVTQRSQRRIGCMKGWFPRLRGQAAVQTWTPSRIFGANWHGWCTVMVSNMTM